MYKVTWDKETGGVLLNLKVVQDALSVSPRPVFFEELDLLGLNKSGWEYPQSEEPIMWACNKQYFYRGEFVFEAKGANIYDTPTIVLQPGVEPMKLQPVDVKAMLEKNNNPLFLIESEAVDFIRDTYLAYSGATKSVETVPANKIDFEALAQKMEKKTKKKMAIVKQDCDSFDIMELDTAQEQGKRVYHATKVDFFLASFSGGKDSQVILDLCTRAIPSTEFQVIYSDTGYEIPSSLELYDEVQAYYKERFPELQFRTAKNHDSVLTYWDKIGTPSDTHRWCCSVMKTAPLYRLLKVPGTNKQGKILTFEGVRAEESTRRSGYDRIGRGVKHSTTINARPIFMWNTTEVFLYMYAHELPINIAYRRGMTRVGCLTCPFASEWNEMIANTHYKKELSPFVERLNAFAKKAGVKDVDTYVREGGWKRRGGGNFVDKTTFVTFKSLSPKFIASIINPQQQLDVFLAAVGDYHIVRNGDEAKGEIKIFKNIYEFTISKEKSKEDRQLFSIMGITDVAALSVLKRALYKASYCIHCEACEVECPTGALSILPQVTINKSKCIHCHKCLNFHEKGCIVANSLSIATMDTKQGNIDRYKNFGLREEWLEAYFIEQNDYWTSDHGLNENYQIPSLKNWLKDAGIIDKSNNVTPLGQLLADARMDRPELIWEIVWINLTYNSFISGWFARNIKTGSKFSQKLMEEMIRDEYPSYKEKTVHNAVYQIQRTLKESPIGGDLCQASALDKEYFFREAYEDLTPEAIAYSLYKFREEYNINSLRVSDFYQEDSVHGPYKEFGISKSAFEKALRTLNSTNNRVLIAELNMGLDHISLREDMTSLDVLKELLQ